MMKWWEDYEFPSELYDAVQKHQQLFKNIYVYPESGSYKIRGYSVEFLFIKKLKNGHIWEGWPHTIKLGKELYD